MPRRKIVLAPEEYDRMEQAWERAAAGAGTDDIAHDLGTTAADLRMRMARAGMPLASARRAYRETQEEARVQAAAAAGRDGGSRARLPEEAIEMAAQEVIDGGEGVNVSRIAYAYGLRPVSLNAAVRRRLEEEGRAGLSSAVARNEHKESVVAEVKQRMAKGQSMVDACREIEANYSMVAKALSRERCIERFQEIRDAMLAEGATADDVATLGAEFRRHRHQVLADGQSLTDWLGPVFRHAAAGLGEDPDKVAPAFALWLSGHY